MRIIFITAILAPFILWSCGFQKTNEAVKLDNPAKHQENVMKMNLIETPLKNRAHAIFAGGCFWCMEPPFEKLKGVYSVDSGYCGGSEPDPDYESVSQGKTTYAEAVLIEYDPQQISFTELLDVFWMNINPVQKDGQFYDRGPQYRTAVFYLNDEQKKMAAESKKQLQQSGKFSQPIVTEISPATDFYKAEGYHQDYYKTNPDHYYRYRQGSGRDAYIRKTWPEYSQ